MCPSHDPRAAGRQGEADAIQGTSEVRWSHPSLRTQPLSKSGTRETKILPELDVRDLPRPRSLINPRSRNSKPGHHLVQGEQICELVCSAGVLESQGLTSSSTEPRDTGQCLRLRGAQHQSAQRPRAEGHAFNWRRTRKSQGTWSPLPPPGGRDEPGFSLEPWSVELVSRGCHARGATHGWLPHRRGCPRG
jgi:hypothetical protein